MSIEKQLKKGNNNYNYTLSDLSKYNIKNTDFEIIWGDNFDDTELNYNNWEYELGCIRNIEQQHYVNNKENIFIRKNPINNNYELVLKATQRNANLQYINPKSSNNDKKKVIYNSGSIRTHGKVEFLYGRIEMRAKLPKGKGVFPAFWTLGSDNIINDCINKSQGYSWARCGEIDIMELVGQDEGMDGNKTVYQTIHIAGNSSPNSYQKLAGTNYKIENDFYDDYHIFGINWTKGKIQWYVDNKIVNSLDYTNNPVALKVIDRPQYIQINLAMGGIWPGSVAENIGNTPQSEYVIDYVCYAQNKQQKEDAKEYYKDAPKIENTSDLVIYEGDTISDILNNVKINSFSNIDFSITDYPNFTVKEKNATNNNPITKVELVHKGKNDTKKLYELPKGNYKLYYTALPKNLSIDNYGKPDGDKNYKFHRVSVNLTIKERNLNTDLKNEKLILNGKINSTLDTIKLPKNWYWEEPKKIISSHIEKVNVLFKNNEGFEKLQTIKINIIQNY